MEVLNISTRVRCCMVDISREVARIVREAGVNSGVCTVYVPHTTAGVTINENADPDVAHDMLAAFSEMVPKMRFRHSEGNSDAHIKTALVGTSATVLIDGGAPVLGTWQGIYLCEFDGPRSRKVYVHIART